VAIVLIVVSVFLGIAIGGPLRENAGTLLGAVYAGLFLLPIVLVVVGFRVMCHNLLRMIEQQ
jgi:hypothetical protein